MPSNTNKLGDVLHANAETAHQFRVLENCRGTYDAAMQVEHVGRSFWSNRALNLTWLQSFVLNGFKFLPKAASAIRTTENGHTPR